MGLFSPAKMAEINNIAKNCTNLVQENHHVSRGTTQKLEEISQKVRDYFPNSPAILITKKEQLHDYITACIEFGVAGIDTETTGLSMKSDTIVGMSLYVPTKDECYIPIAHKALLTDSLLPNQLTYQEVGEELQRLVDNQTKLVFANAGFDIGMIYKDCKVDLVNNFYFDVILAWRCLKEDEKDNKLKSLYAKYVLKHSTNMAQFTDFFDVALFPYCNPDVARLYAANDPKITYELYQFELPYVTKTHPKCIKHHLESVADLVWNIEFKLVPVCIKMSRQGVYLDSDTATTLHERYVSRKKESVEKLRGMVQDVIETNRSRVNMSKAPFRSGAEYNYNSSPQTIYLLYTLMGLANPEPNSKLNASKDTLKLLNNPLANQILEVRAIDKALGTFIDKLPKMTTDDGNIHATFHSIGADTGRFSSSDPNMQQIPSHMTDIRHMFRATPGYVMLSSDYSKMCAVVKPA